MGRLSRLVLLGDPAPHGQLMVRTDKRSTPWPTSSPPISKKDLEDQIYEVESANGTLNLISTTDVIERIGFTSGEERQKVENILRQLDIANGNVHHFLRHLAGAMAISF